MRFDWDLLELEPYFHQLYINFNSREIELVISQMADDVKWANGMEGGYVYGHDGVRDYWTRQFKMVGSRVTPLEFDTENDIIKVKVHQVVYDMENNLLADQIVYHFFRIKEGKIAEFHIGDK